MVSIKNKKQTNLLDIKHKLKKSAIRLFDIPDYGQVDLNLVNMANFFPLLQDIIDSVRPKIICEIGSDQGITSDLLYQYCKVNGANLHVVDPVIHENRKSDNILTCYREMSITYLQEAEPADIYFLDGDHNHYTALNELRLIRDKNTAETPRLLFLHDVGWPWGYRDMYYNERTIEKKYQKKTASGLNVSVFSPQYTVKKQGLPMNGLSVAIEDGGEANGVLAAIEYFLKESPEWMYFSIPSIFGLGVLWYGKGACEETVRKIEQLAEDFRSKRAFLSILEFNRIILLEKLQETGVIWQEQKDYIEELLENRKMLEEKIQEQGKVWKEQKDYIEELLENRKMLEEKIQEQGKVWKEQQNYIGELVKRNVSLDLKIMKLESPLGWLKNTLNKILI